MIDDRHDYIRNEDGSLGWRCANCGHEATWRAEFPDECEPAWLRAERNADLTALEPPEDTFALEMEDSDRRDELCRWLGIARELGDGVFDGGDIEAWIAAVGGGGPLPFADDGSGSDALALSARVAARLCARDGARPELAALYERLAEAARSFGASSRRLRHAYDWDDRNRRHGRRDAA